MTKTTIPQKILLVFLGLFLSIVLLEVGLRVGGFIFLKMQEKENRTSLSQEGEYRILCLGESTTALGGEYSYPRQLEQILNASQDKSTFTVINKGIPATTTLQILARLEGYLKTYKPHMVITMMGINDWLEGETVVTSSENLTDRFRVLKLGKLLWMHLTHKRQEVEKDRLDRQLQELEKKVLLQPTSGNLTKLSAVYRAANKPEKEKETILKALRLNPQNYEALGYLGYYYKRTGEYGEAIKAFKEAIDLMEEERDYKITLYAELAECYKLSGQPQEAEKLFIEILRARPQHSAAYGLLGELYLERDQYEEARRFFERQITINPSAVQFYGKLAHCYMKSGEYSSAQRLLEQGIRINPQELELYVELGYLFLESKEYVKAEDVLKIALHLNKKDFRGMNKEIYRHLLICYEAQSKVQEARELIEFLQGQEENLNLQIYQSYQKLAGMLAQKGIPLVVVQYPMRSIEPLKEALRSKQGVVFVDNERIFKDAVAQEGFDVYFSDRFAGDFGHCTPKGNYLLARNIARTILRIILDFKGKEAG